MAGDINDHFSAFPRAMKLAVGTICVIDAECKVLDYLWSLMDIYVSVQRKKKDNNYKLDFYTTSLVDKLVVGCTDGFIQSDLDSLETKRERELKFPFDLIEKACKVGAFECADYESNKYIEKYVINAITGIPKILPTDVYPSCGDFKLILRGIFVSLSKHRLIIKHVWPSEGLSKYFEASICNLNMLNSREDLAVPLFESLPSTVQYIYINLIGNETFDPSELCNYVSNLEKLKVLKIFRVKLSVATISALCSKHFTTIKSLALVDCDIQDSDMTEIIEIIRQCGELEEVDLSENNILDECNFQQINEMLVKRNRDVKFHPSALCCTIERVEMRGITIQQLENVFNEVKTMYEQGKIKKSLDMITMDDIKDKIILNRTRERIYCSYVECIAEHEQKTTWCVVFRNSQSFKDILTVLKQHAKDRELSPTDSYWMHVRID